MALGNRRKEKVCAPVEGVPPARVGRKRKVLPVEVKLLAMDAMEAGLTRGEVCELVGVRGSSIAPWRKLYPEGGAQALLRKTANPGSGRICHELTRRIEQMRRDHPEAGGRKIRDELRRDQGVGVSAETAPASKRGAASTSCSSFRTSAPASRSAPAWSSARPRRPTFTPICGKPLNSMERRWSSNTMAGQSSRKRRSRTCCGSMA